MSLREQTARALVSEVAGREAIAFIVPLLQRAGIPVMPLKGAWLQACVYGSAGNGRGANVVGVRVITDVDLLVPEARFADALAALRAGGFRARPAHTASAQALDHPALTLPLDLHCRLFTRGAFRLATDALFERARPDQSAFGVPVLLPDPQDVFAHLVGHFLKSRTRCHDQVRLADFAAIAARYELDPRRLAQHLDRAGMARAARYVLHHLADADGNSFCRDVLEALPADAFGARLAAAARFAQGPLHGQLGPLGALPGFLLDRSLVAGGLSLTLRLSELAWHRAAARRRYPL